MEWVHTAIGWVIRAITLCVMIFAIWWVLTHPQDATHLLSVVLSGIVNLAEGIVNAVTGAFS